MEQQGKTNKKQLGTAGEDFAASFLENNRFTLLCRNFRFGRLGEVDIIAREGEYICFIEVKTRSNRLFGSPAEAVDQRKQRTLRQIAMIYLKHNHLTDCYIRFDVAEVDCAKTPQGSRPTSVNLIRNAF